MGNSIDTLAHFGIRGMRWGRRKGKTPHLEVPSEDHKEKIRIKSKKLSEMSNAELKTVNERLRLEKQYKELATEDLSRGQKFVRDMLLNSAQKTANQQANKYMTKATEAAIAKVMAM